MDCLPGFDARKSVAPTTVKPSNILTPKVAASFVALPLIVLTEFFIFATFGILLITFCIIPPGTPNCVKKPTNSPCHVSGLSGSLSCINSSNAV